MRERLAGSSTSFKGAVAYVRTSVRPYVCPSVRPYVLGTLLLAAPLHVFAQARELHWPAVAVEARLDSAGRLHVKERQTMLFTGDWNGGERRFDVRLGQDFEFERLVRIDSVTGAEHPLRGGDLPSVDEYRWMENRTLHWRARRPSDPPFDRTAITYVLEYSLGNILVPRGAQYVLNHDFAFADRVGTIEQFTLSLAIDPRWRPTQAFTGSFGPTLLPPGEGFMVTVPLQFVGGGRPLAVHFGASSPARGALLLAFFVALALIGAAFLRRERGIGRFDPLPPLDAIDEAWLKEHVFHLLPEAVGAAWDSTTAAAEVAAVLARLVGEKKLASEVESSGWGIFRSDVMKLRLLVDRSVLQGHERTLVDALFGSQGTSTDTDEVRKRYAKSGFDPASKIKAPIENLIRAAVKPGGGVARPSRWRSFGLFVGGAILLIAGASLSPADALVAIVGAVACIVVLVFAAPAAFAWRSRVHQLAPHALRFLVPLGMLAVALAVVLLWGSLRTGLAVLAGLTALALAIVNIVFNAAKSRESAERIALRQRLCAAREYFRRELRRQQPRLRDDWFPYLIAFGLGPNMDRWFRAFGGEQAVPSTHHHSSTSFGTSSSSSGSSSGTSWTGMGGGGGFSGGGSSGSWAAAAGVMAAGVAQPSSGSSGGGGGGGGGGSSGGGGGGGW